MTGADGPAPALPRTLSGVPAACYARGMERECPQCGERMRFVTRETVTRVPGTSQEVRRTTHEWVCRECDYFEEVDGAEPDA